MNKKIIKLSTILIIILIALGSACFYYYKTNQKSSNSTVATANHDIINKDELNELNLYHLGVYEAVSRDDKGKVTAYKFLGLKDPEPINLELMTDAEKAERYLAPGTKAQVLERDANGKIVKYDAKINKIQPLRG